MTEALYSFKMNQPSLPLKLKTLRIVSFSLLAIAVIALVLVICLAPNAQFNYIFGEMSWTTILIFAVIVLIYWTAYSYDEKRDSKIYLTSTGDLDISTPRCYTPMKVNFISKILGRANIFWQKNLEEFTFADGKLSVINSAGDYVSGPLESLTFSYKMDKNKATDELYIYQYRITDSDGNSVKFNRHDSLFNDEEYSDMEMILSLCGTVDESKISKFSKKLDSALSTIQDLDFSNLAGSATEMVSGKVSDTAMSKVGKLAKAKIAGKSNAVGSKTKSIFKKIFKYCLWAILAIYALAVIFVNVEPLFDGSDEDYEDYLIEDCEVAATAYDEDTPKNLDKFLETASGDMYKCTFFDINQEFYLSLNLEEGVGTYLSPSGFLYTLSVKSQDTVQSGDDTVTMLVCSVLKSNKETTNVVFYINLPATQGPYIRKIFGQMLDAQGTNTYEFAGEGFDFVTAD